MNAIASLNLPIKSLLGDLCFHSINADLTPVQLRAIHELADADLITLRNGLTTIGELMSLAGEGDNHLGAIHLGNIGDLLALMGRHINDLHVIDDAVEASLSNGVTYEY